MNGSNIKKGSDNESGMKKRHSNQLVGMNGAHQQAVNGSRHDVASPPGEQNEPAFFEPNVERQASDEEILWKNEAQAGSPHQTFWNRKQDEFSKPAKEGDVEGMIDVLRSIPHMESERSSLEKFLQDAHEVVGAQELTREELDGNSKQIYDMLQTAEMKNLFLQNEAIKAAKHKAILRIVEKLTMVARAAVHTEGALKELSALSQAEGSLYVSTASASKRRKKSDMLRKEAEKILKEEDDYQRPTGPNQLTGCMRKNCREFNNTFNKQSLLASVPSPRLVRISKVFQDSFQSSTFLQSPAANDSKENKEKFKEEIQKSVGDLKRAFSSVLEGSDSPGTQPKYSFPGPKSGEVDGVQPFVTALFEAVADCVQLDFIEGEEMTAPPSPPKTISQQKVVYGGEVRRDRKCDACVWKRGKYLVVMLDGFMHLTFEIKPGRRSSKDMDDLRREATDQCLSHASKSLQHCLRFADGAGIPSHATSALGTLVYIEVVQLKLLDPGKTTSRVEMVSSGPLPLVSQVLFDRWFDAGNDSKKHAQTEMRNNLFPSTNTSNDKKDDVPLGFMALYALMSSSRQKLFGPERGNVSKQLGPLLGTGTFGMVFQSAREKEQAIKVSKSGIRYFIKNEAAILGSLANVRDRPASVPELVSSGLLDVNIGGVSLKLPAIALKPVGQDIYPILLSTKSHFGEIIDKILEGITSALDFLHGNSISHNDVSDRNILLVGEESSGYRAVLVDFSEASQMHVKRSGFCGTPPFVHRDVHKNYEWYPVSEYDKTSLGLTLVALLGRGVIPWKVLSDKGPVDGDYLYEKRINAACQCLAAVNQNKTLKPETSKTVKELFMLDEQKFIGKQRRGSTQSQTEGQEDLAISFKQDLFDNSGAS